MPQFDPRFTHCGLHEEGLRRHQHVLPTLGAYHLVPLFSVLAYDVECGGMSVYEAVELYEELMDFSVAQPKVVHRELTNQMVRCYCLNEEYEKALGVVLEVKAKEIRRTFVTYAPLFRIIRASEDAERQLTLLKFVYDVEGGRLLKLLYIDIPRMLYMFGVFVCYNWVFISCIFTVVCTIVVLYVANFGL
ncbi:hypothetical protein TraAM80_01786 [Trypanosoma rangeli]|uniref:Uncharacterized protein n=1 Tax=Trypanosoma rangeli TaxID=5698 RepID=A0A422NX51_TRYRA|nr:uncharacterized protein TraAM80_01786 [Trypanosoma rangeli]RNF10048.1 hypothetical protein TraAM80_01786 [Trypanosoma rangeli]|eukprot:RNF10048.1 hypothetical protein TraAM80_01786 [Trypanosoma rangeli]